MQDVRPDVGEAEGARHAGLPPGMQGDEAVGVDEWTANLVLCLDQEGVGRDGVDVVLKRQGAERLLLTGLMALGFAVPDGGAEDVGHLTELLPLELTSLFHDECEAGPAYVPGRPAGGISRGLRGVKVEPEAPLAVAAQVLREGAFVEDVHDESGRLRPPVNPR